MAINVYSGLMGHGKSYEVVANVLLPAILKGRRVVTNIAGLQVEDIHAYLLDKNDDADREKLGDIVFVQNDDILKPQFFPVEVKEGETPPESVVKAGDLLLLDEVWRFWGSGSRIDPAHMHFFRMHRHFVDAITANTCDIALIVQDVQDLNRNLKLVVENTYRMTKLKSIGMPTRYRVDIFQSYRTNRAPSVSYQRKYDKEIFPLYKSYSQGAKAGNEVPIDKRGNILRSGFFTILLPFFVLVVLPFAVWQVNGFFSRGKPKDVPNLPASAPASSSSRSVPTPPKPPADWRILGYYRHSGSVYVLVYQPPDRYRTLVNPMWFDLSTHPSGFLDGSPISDWSGVSPKSPAQSFSSPIPRPVP